MKKLFGWIYINRTIEESIFSIILLVGIPYFILNEIIDLTTNQSPVIFTINALLTALIIYFLRLSMKKSLTQKHILFFSAVLLVVFSLFWPYSTGLSASSSYVFLTLIVVLILINKGRAKLFFAVSLFILILVAGFVPIQYNVEISYVGELISFLLNLLCVALILLIFKAALSREHAKLATRIEKLNALNSRIEEQNQALKERQEEVLRIQNHLQDIINERTAAIEKENERLIEYAFINAHLVRAPLANLIGLSQIKMKDQPAFRKIFDKTQKMDGIIRKIAGVLSISAQ